MQIETAEVWSEEYADPSSEAYTTLVSSVSDAVTASFEDSATDGYLLTEVDVTLAQGEHATKDCFLDVWESRLKAVFSVNHL